MYFWKMINMINIIQGWFYRLTHKNTELVKKRLKICNTCEHKVQLTKNVSFCNMCWCELKAKASVEDEKCLMNKWNE